MKFKPAAVLVAACALAANAFALNLSKPITIVVPFGAGGVADVATRTVAAKLAQNLKVAVIIDNKPGANANIGAAAVVQAQPDGQTLLTTTSFINTNFVLEKSLQWRQEDLVPVARMTVSPSVLVVAGNSPYTQFSEFLAAAKDKPNMAFGSGGAGITQTVAMALFADAAKLRFLTVQYKTGPSILPDVMNGNLAVSIMPINNVTGLIKTGQVRGLAVTSPQRAALLPDVPTFGELGYPQADLESWLGIHAPARTPPETVKMLSTALRDALADSDVRLKLEALGINSAYLDNAGFQSFLVQDRARAQRYGRILETTK